MLHDMSSLDMYMLLHCGVEGYVFLADCGIGFQAYASSFYKLG